MDSADVSSRANLLYEKHIQEGEISFLDEAVDLGREALDLCPTGHPDYSLSLNNLGLYLSTRYKQLGALQDLEEAILLGRGALDRCPIAHPHCFMSLINLTADLPAQYQQLGDLQDLEEAIALGQETLDRCPKGPRAHRLSCLSSLARCLLDRFQLLGEMDDIEDAIARHRDAIDLIPGDAPDKSHHLNSLAACYRMRFMHFGERNDLEQAISGYWGAVNIASDARTDNLKLGRRSPVARVEPSDLERALSLLRDTVHLTSDDHPLKSYYLDGLVNCHLARFEHFGEVSDLEEATSIHKNAAELKLSPWTDPVVRVGS